MTTNQRVVYESLKSPEECARWLDNLVGNYHSTVDPVEIVEKIEAFQVVYGDHCFAVIAVLATYTQEKLE